MKMAVLSKTIYTPTETPIKIPVTSYREIKIGKKILKFIRSHKIFQIAKGI